MVLPTVLTRWCAALYRSQHSEQRHVPHQLHSYILSHPRLQLSSRCRVHQAASSSTMIPAPVPSNARPKDASMYKDMVVQNEVTALEPFEPCAAAEALQQLFPVLFKTSTSAKKACRYLSTASQNLNVVFTTSGCKTWQLPGLAAPCQE